MYTEVNIYLSDSTSSSRGEFCFTVSCVFVSDSNFEFKRTKPESKGLLTPYINVTKIQTLLSFGFYYIYKKNNRFSSGKNHKQNDSLYTFY